MGLDMYLNAKKGVAGSGLTVEGLEVTAAEVEVCYWRKDWELQGLIGDVLEEPIENCRNYYVGEKDLVNLIDRVQGGAVEDYDEDDIKNTITQLNKALELKRKGWDIIYYAGW